MSSAVGVVVGATLPHTTWPQHPGAPSARRAMKRQTAGARGGVQGGKRSSVPSRNDQVRQMRRTSRGAADACAAKREAWGEARGWKTPPPLRRVRRDAEAPEEPETEATAAQEEAKGEAEVEVVEEEGGSGYAVMELGE